VSEHSLEVGAQHHHSGSRAARRTPVGDQSLAEWARQLGVAEHPVAAPEPPGRARLGWVTRGDGVLGDEGRGHPDQLVGGKVGGIDRRRAEARGSQHADQAEVGSAATGCAGGEDALCELG